MKRLFLFSMVFLMTIATQAQMKNDAYEFSFESATRFIDLAKATTEGHMPTDADWNELFATEGYRAAFSGRDDSLEWKQSIKDAFMLVFDKNKTTIVDSIVALPMEKRGEQFYFIYNFKNLKEHVGEMHSFMHHTDFSKMERHGNALAKRHLPKTYRDIQPNYQKYYFVAWDPESRAWDGIFLDIYSFYSEGRSGMPRLLGHEMHHHYFAALLEKKYTKDTQDPALIAIYRMQNEGTADLINKKEMPTSKLGGYDEEAVKIYNADYLSSPSVLAELDSLTCGYLDGSLSMTQYRKAQYCAHMDGHTTGDYMTFLIRKHFGLKAAINCLGDFPAFVRLYNEAARKSGTYMFTDRFVKHIEEETEKMK